MKDQRVSVELKFIGDIDHLSFFYRTKLNVNNLINGKVYIRKIRQSTDKYRKLERKKPNERIIKHTKYIIPIFGNFEFNVYEKEFKPLIFK